MVESFWLVCLVESRYKLLIIFGLRANIRGDMGTTVPRMHNIINVSSFLDVSSCAFHYYTPNFTTPRPTTYLRNCAFRARTTPMSQHFTSSRGGGQVDDDCKRQKPLSASSEPAVSIQLRKQCYQRLSYFHQTVAAATNYNR